MSHAPGAAGSGEGYEPLVAGVGQIVRTGSMDLTTPNSAALGLSVLPGFRIRGH